ENERETYLEGVLDQFKSLMQNEEEESWHQEYGWKILSTMASELSEDQRGKAKKLFGKPLDINFEPELVEIEGVSRFVQERSPVTFEEEEYRDISNVLKDLKGSLSPESLKKRYVEDGLLNPRVADGLMDTLRTNMKDLMFVHLDYDDAFMDEEICRHYTYGLLRVVEDFLEIENKLSKADWHNLFKIWDKIIKSPPLEQNSE